MAKRVHKTNLDELAREACWFAGMKGEQAPGLARLFKIIEQEAFCAGAKIGRASSYAADPEDLYHQYVDDAQGRAPTSPTAPIAEAPPEIEPAAIEDTPEVL